MVRRLLETLLYFPDRVEASGGHPPHGAEDVWVETGDGERLHGWWFAGGRAEPLAHLIFCHGNGGNVAGRVPFARLLAGAGLDVLLFDYRGYGRSSGRPTEEGTYEDARAARRAVLARDGVDPARLVLLGESLGGAVALKLAIEYPPAGLILQSAFTSVRDVAAVHYPFIPRALVPDAYPSRQIVPALRAPLLVLHGARDDVVPVSHGRALYEGAPEPKRLRIFPNAGHNDIGGAEWIGAVESWALELLG